MQNDSTSDYLPEALRIRANQPTPKIEFYASKTKMFIIVIISVLFLLGVLAVLFSSGQNIEATYEQHKVVVLIFGGISVLAVVRGFIWFNQRNKPALILSEEGIFVGNMYQALPLTQIDQIELETFSHMGNKTWIFHFNLISDAPELKLKGIDFNSKYIKSSHSYRFETLPFKGYSQHKFVELVNEYQYIIAARESLNQ
ncbi:hypothetical protein [Thorsellia anophelis]|uniref:Transmembrane protein n=1 Tax=Thorsellia anophelis DSM 18579 TaxID=1123402 RepID=A0A1I0DLB5_9GAMM|nr:hypothetical protein [Thorsellia anophelis]SET32888.1 hypothetical protein SAMN02583745_02028 [Thorsellia anophelis DSM 18579]